MGIVLQPRDYQVEAIENTIKGFTVGLDGEPPADRLLGVMATGGGKTVVFSLLTEYFQKQCKWRTLILADQTELLEQARDELMAACGLYAQIEQDQSHASPGADVVIASVQSMVNRLEKYPRDNFQLIICDEADRSVSPQWQKVLAYFDQKAKVLGVTATPFRADKKSILGYFRQTCFNVPMVKLINEGYLSPIEVEQLPITIDLSGIHQQGGDFDRDELDAVLAPAFDQVCQSILERAQDRKKILVFQPLVATSLRFVQACARAGISARHVDGDSKGRDDTLRDFRDAKFRVLSNAMLLNRGYNDPSIDCVVIMRPTRSRAMYWQMVGRGTRLWCPQRCPTQCDHQDAKKNMLLLDFLWQHGKIAPMRPADLIAETEAQAAAITRRIARDPQKRMNLMVADSEAAREAELKLLKHFEAGWKSQSPNLVAAGEFAALAHRLDLADFEALSDVEARPTTPGQVSFLERLGIAPESVKNRAHASAIIDLAVKRREAGYCTVKQARLLLKYGVKAPELVSLENAKTYISAKMSRGQIWLPKGFDLYAPPGPRMVQEQMVPYDPNPEADRGPDPDDYITPGTAPAVPEEVAKVPGGGGSFERGFAALKAAVAGAPRK